WPANSNSTPPAVFGARKVAATMSLKARDSRGARVKLDCGATVGHAVPIAAMKHRYVAVTFKPAVYDVLNARASEKNGAPPTIEAAAGRVTSSAPTVAARKSR